jgi:hypothetical protein
MAGSKHDCVLITGKHTTINPQKEHCTMRVIPRDAILVPQYYGQYVDSTPSESQRRPQHHGRQQVESLRRRPMVGKLLRFRRPVEGTDESEHKDDKFSPSLMDYEVIRDADGILYRIPRQRTNQANERRRGVRMSPQSDQEFARIFRGRDGRLYRIVESPAHEKKEQYQKSAEIRDEKEIESPSVHQEQATNPEFAPAADDQTQALSTSNKSQRHTRSKRLTQVLVEDASDSESEEVDVWRIRRPSPGKWIEPVEHFVPVS